MTLWDLLAIIPWAFVGVLTVMWIWHYAKRLL